MTPALSPSGAAIRWNSDWGPFHRAGCVHNCARGRENSSWSYKDSDGAIGIRPPLDTDCRVLVIDRVPDSRCFIKED